MIMMPCNRGSEKVQLTIEHLFNESLQLDTTEPNAPMIEKIEPYLKNKASEGNRARYNK